MFELAMTAPDAVIAIATDAVYATKRLACDEGQELGQFEVQQYDRGIFVQPGVSFLYKGDERFDRYRGFDRGTLDPDVILDAWARHKPTIEAKAHRFTTLGTAIAGRLDRREQIARLIDAEAACTWYPPDPRPSGIKPDWVYKEGRWKLAGEWSDVPRKYLNLGERTSPPRAGGRILGDADDVATQYGMNSDELRAWLARPVETYAHHRAALTAKLIGRFESMTDGELRDLSPPVFRSWRDLDRTLDVWAQRGKRRLPGRIAAHRPDRGLVPLVATDALCPDLLSKESPKMAIGAHDDDDLADLEEELQ